MLHKRICRLFALLFLVATTLSAQVQGDLRAIAMAFGGFPSTPPYRATIWFTPQHDVRSSRNEAIGSFIYGNAVFDDSGNVIASDAENVVAIDPNYNQTTFVSLWPAGAIVRNRRGDYYLAHLGTNVILRVDRNRARIETFAVPGISVIQAMDLAADQCTLYLTGFRIGRFNVCTQTDLGTIGGSSTWALRVLPDNSLLTVGIGGVQRMSPAGQILRTYQPTASTPTSIALSPDGRHAYLSTVNGPFGGGVDMLMDVDLESGVVTYFSNPQLQQRFEGGVSAITLAVRGGFWAAAPPEAGVPKRRATR